MGNINIFRNTAFTSKNLVLFKRSWYLRLFSFGKMLLILCCLPSKPHIQMYWTLQVKKFLFCKFTLHRCKEYRNIAKLFCVHHVHRHNILFPTGFKFCRCGDMSHHIISRLFYKFRSGKFTETIHQKPVLNTRVNFEYMYCYKK